MRELTIFARTPTTFAADGTIDEAAQRAFLQRLADAGIAVYLGSAGTGEGHALTADELRRVYQIGVEVCRGKVPVYANPPEHHTARLTIAQTQLAIECGVEAVNVYALTGWHNMFPTEQEMVAYFDEVLGQIRHPVALAINPVVVGYRPPAHLVAGVCRRHKQVFAVNLTGVDDGYVLELKALLDPAIEVYVQFTGSLNMLAAGVSGILATEATILPETFRRYLDLYRAREFEAQAAVYEELKRYLRYCYGFTSTNTRWIKMAMRVLRLPGGEGGLREPYRMPPEDDLKRFAEGLMGLGIAELDALGEAAGLDVAGKVKH